MRFTWSNFTFNIEDFLRVQRKQFKCASYISHVRWIQVWAKVSTETSSSIQYFWIFIGLIPQKGWKWERLIFSYSNEYVARKARAANSVPVITRLLSSSEVGSDARSRLIFCLSSLIRALPDVLQDFSKLGGQDLLRLECGWCINDVFRLKATAHRPTNRTC